MTPTCGCSRRARAPLHRSTTHAPCISRGSAMRCAARRRCSPRAATLRWSFSRTPPSTMPRVVVRAATTCSWRVPGGTRRCCVRSAIRTCRASGRASIRRSSIRARGAPASAIASWCSAVASSSSAKGRIWSSPPFAPSISDTPTRCSSPRGTTTGPRPWPASSRPDTCRACRRSCAVSSTSRAGSWPTAFPPRRCTTSASSRRGPSPPFYMSATWPSSPTGPRAAPTSWPWKRWPRACPRSSPPTRGSATC